jgi:uncharacterized ubiquitin-like protein YukD
MTFTIQDLNSYKIQYIDTTHKLNDYNEINNLNQHLLSTNTAELSRLQTMNNQVKTKVLKMKQDYLLTDYGINEYSLYNNLLAFTVIMTCFTLFFVANVQDKKMLIWICVGLGLFYLVVVMLVLSSNSKRRKYAWNQWYWNPMQKKN